MGYIPLATSHETLFRKTHEEFQIDVPQFQVCLPPIPLCKDKWPSISQESRLNSSNNARVTNVSTRSPLPATHNRLPSARSSLEFIL